ncbi:MAG: hypothetical protein MUO23_11620 [Anaerolineales bacterium]|nr:hypothetical protein [Anaerolineales bacterium]
MAPLEDRMRRLRHPALLLYFLSPIVAELLSGSAPPAEFFNPFTFILLTAFYGSAALVVRELTFRWRKGWPTVLILGLAYGIVEEGLAVKSFFDPAWIDLGPLGVYGRWAGVNWVWSAGLTLYHAVFSIAIPILLTCLIFPDWVDRPWLSRRTFRLWSVVLALVVLFCNLFLTAYRPPWTHLALAGAAVLGLGLMARKLPQTLPLDSVVRLRRPRALFWRSFAATIGLFVTLWALPNTPIPPGVTLILMFAWAGIFVCAACRLTKHAAWSRSHAVAAVSGALLFFVLLAPVAQLDPQAADNRSGMTWVALGMGLFLIWLERRNRRPIPDAEADPPMDPAPVDSRIAA